MALFLGQFVYCLAWKLGMNWIRVSSNMCDGIPGNRSPRLLWQLPVLSYATEQLSKGICLGSMRRCIGMGLHVFDVRARTLSGPLEPGTFPHPLVS